MQIKNIFKQEFLINAHNKLFSNLVLLLAHAINLQDVLLKD